jgi:DNA-directed RNA polymerase beta' subunit/DNA-directed RNA polymerase subunit K/omega
MNIHVPQGAYEQAEALKLMHFSRNLINDQSNRPVTGLIQDALLAASLMTGTVTVMEEGTETISVRGEETTRPKIIRRSVDVEEDMKRGTWQDCVAVVDGQDKLPSLLERCQRLGVNPYSGRGLFSILFPEDFVYSGRSPDKTTPVEVRGGILVRGTLSQSTLNTAQNSIHHELFLRYGPSVATRFLSDARFLCHRWLQAYGFSLGYKDFALSREARADIEDTKSRLIEGVSRTARAGEGATGALAQHVEADVVRGSNNILDQISGTVMRHLLANSNRFLAMVSAGSKGTATSITQMLGAVGQITIQQERPASTLSDRRRTDLHFAEDDPNPAARGLCTTSYERGLSPSGMFFQGMATHQAAFDISVHTGDTGYTQRKLVMFMIHFASQVNGSVTTADGSFVQYRYGGDGLTPSRVLNVGGKARFINFDSVVDAVKLEVALARSKNVRLPEATRHFLTPFEEAKLVAKRAIALQMGATPLLKPRPGLPISAVLLANAELEEGLLEDVTVYRQLASGSNGEVTLRTAVGVNTSVKTGL